MLLVSRTRTNLGDRAFSAAGPRDYNFLLTDLRQPDLSCSRWKHFYLVSAQWDESAEWNPFTCVLEVLLYTYLLTYWFTLMALIGEEWLTLLLRALYHFKSQSSIHQLKIPESSFPANLTLNRALPPIVQFDHCSYPCYTFYSCRISIY